MVEFGFSFFEVHGIGMLCFASPRRKAKQCLGWLKNEGRRHDEADEAPGRHERSAQAAILICQECWSDYRDC